MSPPASTKFLLWYIDGNRLFNSKPTIRVRLTPISGPPGTKSPSGRHLLMAANTLSKSSVPGPSRCYDHINLETHQLGRKLKEPIDLPLRISVLGGDVLSFYIAMLAQSQPNSLGTGGLSSCIDRH